MENFYIGQIFEGGYPEEASQWCNEGKIAHIDEISSVDGIRRFEIVKNAPLPETKIVRTFAKDAIWVATKDMIADENTGETVWEKFKTFLLDSGLWEGWSMQAYLLEANPFFAEFYPKAVEVFDKELVDSVLAASVVETKTVFVEQ
jgi:predicted SnoaL-like aldol condensation-catalyzing enzyme